MNDQKVETNLKKSVSLLLFLPILAFSQDTLKIMTSNLLNYTTSNFSRDQYYRTILRHVKPDILVVQEMTSQAAVDSFYNHVVNLVFPGQFSKGVFSLGPDTGNEMYYRTSKVTFVTNTPIHTALRDISEFKVVHTASAETLRVYSVHLKASTGFEADRAAEVDSLRKRTNALPPEKYFMVMGDFNIYSSTEPAYQKLLQVNPTDDGRFVDTIHITGIWNNGAYAQYHTQSTRTRAFGGGATGGMDDRFDMILFSRAAAQGKISYVAGSMTPIGNDGNHYNDSINQMPNTAVPDSVVNALHYASDHLPVSAKFVLQTSIRASIVALLEGPYNSGALQMERTLNTGGILGAHFSGVNIPSDAVDSISIELRSTAVNPTTRKFRPAWLLANGSIRSFTDTTKNYVEFDTLTGSYYMVVHHRNHLSIMTSTAISLSTATSFPHDFTTGQGQAYGTDPMRQIGSKFLMYAGDVNSSGSITETDLSGVFSAANTLGYSYYDINLTGIVSAADGNMIFSNLNKTTQVPAPTVVNSLTVTTEKAP